jgi:PhoPQ-activated pathogenicity-related protein
MVKGSIRALDTITDFVNTNLPHLGCQIDYYIVAGASKRGWTTWLVGAVDPVRVKAIVPIVLDAINFVPVMHHAYRSYGGWSFALEDYIESLDKPITSRFDDPNMILLQQYIDPYYYRDRLTMPKMVVNAVLDEFQQPDDTHYWWKDMPEPKHFLIVPNAEHSQITGVLMVVPSIAAFALANFLNKPVPTFTWDLDVENGKDE